MALAPASAFLVMFPLVTQGALMAARVGSGEVEVFIKSDCIFSMTCTQVIILLSFVWGLLFRWKGDCYFIHNYTVWKCRSQISSIIHSFIPIEHKQPSTCVLLCVFKQCSLSFLCQIILFLFTQPFGGFHCGILSISFFPTALEFDFFIVLYVLPPLPGFKRMNLVIFELGFRKNSQEGPNKPKKICIL